MDTKLADALATSALQFPAAGIVVGDSLGLCIASTGQGAAPVAAYAAAILQRATTLHGIASDEGGHASPVVRIETEDSYVHQVRFGTW
jgi:hypothetical protein